MTSAPTLSAQQAAQIKQVHAEIGEITVQAEHINWSMSSCVQLTLQEKGLDAGYAQVVTAGFNVEPMRRLWTSLMAYHFASDEQSQKMIIDISNRVDAINRRRNNVVHRLWFVGFGSDPTDSLDVAAGMKTTYDNKKGGVQHSMIDSKDFQNIIGELKVVKELVERVLFCVAAKSLPTKNFHYVKGKSGNDVIVGGPTP